MKSETKWDIVKDSITARLGGSPSSRLVRRLTSYAYNILVVAGWPALDSADYETIINGVCNAANVGKEEL